ncbi:C13 family peptidase [Variovorax sp. KK3]|uniref:C13 family peptidase n=1 Tax=Variovorax sp. KK3 TaxID=1855728 RepID=UPI0015C359D9|nr:C13 family peptidase [Variovorax sp. KK3]
MNDPQTDKDEDIGAPAEARAAAEGKRAPAAAPLGRWMAAGLRASLMLAPRIEGSPRPWQLMLLVAIPSLLFIALARLQIDGPARFHPLPALESLWPVCLMLWLGWWTLTPGSNSGSAPDARRSSLSRWFALGTWAALPWTLLMIGLSIAYFRGWLPAALTTTRGFWTVYGALLGISVMAAVWLMARCAPNASRLAIFVPGLLALSALDIWQSLQVQDRYWQEEVSASSKDERPRMYLSQELFEAQQAVWQRAVDGIAPRREGQANVYGLVFAPYASEDVFLRESRMVTEVLEERFDAKGRVLRLLNHVSTAQELPWATPLNLQRAIAAMGERMNRDEDLLVIYMTSHGARDFKLASSHWPLTVQWLTPQQLREALDAAGIRHRVVAISACYSGGWIEPLATDDSLIMTAADADHTSYGCGHRSELTFFGRALFDEELRKRHSFEAAFAAAVPVIKQREIDAGKEDGFSNPQISWATASGRYSRS